jgi:hypothetical protein
LKFFKSFEKYDSVRKKYDRVRVFWEIFAV